MFSGKKIVYVDMDHTLCDYDAGYKGYQLMHPGTEYPQSVPGFFMDLKPLHQSVETFLWLSAQDNLEVFILTAPSILNPHCYTEKRNWVEKHIGLEFVERLIISAFKGLNKGHYLIDDKSSGRGQEYFEGALVEFGSERFPDWLAVKEYFTQS